MEYLNIFNEGEACDSELILKRGVVDLKPIFSIFIPTFNRVEFLKEAINSALNQDFIDNYEIVVIDNFSDFKNFILAKEYINGLIVKNNVNISFCRCHSHSNSWNMGILKSTANWVIMLHDDDLLKNNHLTEIDKIILSNPEIKILCSDSYNLIQTSKLSVFNKIFMIFKEFIKRIKNDKLIKLKVFDFYFHNPASNTGVVLNRQVALEQGGFNSFKDSPIPDYSFFYRLTRDFNQTYYYNKKLSYIRFAENDGLKKEVIWKVRVKSDEIRKDILINNHNLKNNDFRFRDFTLYLNKLEQSPLLTNTEKYVKVPFLTIYTRIVSLFVFYKSIST
jgi:glycosyltransferase involved in cell wall biosynthesis